MIIIMNIYVPGDKIDKPHIYPHSSTSNGFASLSEEFIHQLSDTQRNLISYNVSK